MQTLGLSDSTPRTESRVKSLLWPAITNEGDVDYLTQQGFWICFLVAVFTLAVSVMTRNSFWGTFEAAFFFLGGIGVRERSRFAAVAVFAAYLLGALVLQKHAGQGFGIVRIIFLALLLANVRGMWLSASWPKTEGDAPAVRLNQTLGDKLSDQMPAFLWPKTRALFYVLAVIEIALLIAGLVAPRPPRAAGAAAGIRDWTSIYRPEELKTRLHAPAPFCVN